jgi:hypothetical protein
MNSRSNWSAMLDELLDDDSDSMTPGDAEFLDSLHNQRGEHLDEESDVFDPDWEPSDAQWKWLDDIYTRVFG